MCGGSSVDCLCRKLSKRVFSAHWWPMPLEDSYKKHIEGGLSDLKNSNFSWQFAGSITAALFLQNFIDKKVNHSLGDILLLICSWSQTPWVHLDISGPTWTANSPGWGVHFFSDFLAAPEHNVTMSEDDYWDSGLILLGLYFFSALNTLGKLHSRERFFVLRICDSIWSWTSISSADGCRQ